MAHAYHDQRSGGAVIVVPHHPNQVINLRTVNPPQFGGFFPGPLGVINPSFQPLVPHVEVLNRPLHPSPVAVPVRFALNPSVLIRMDQERTDSLLQFMANEGLVPSAEEELKRENVIEKLKQLVFAWIKKIAWQRRFPREQITATSATVLTYGSYGLGVHDTESDIDALCVGPYFATMAEDFFVVLHNMLKSRPEISEIICVKDAKVPLMRFKIDGISIDLPYAQLKVLSVPENVDALNPLYIRDIDETSWKSLSGVRANKSILQLVPNVENFQAMLRCVKLWAKRRGVYGNLLGFFGGVHLAILAAFVCQRNPNASLNVLISSFFRTFAFWPWPTPVMLQDGLFPAAVDSLETRCIMPIRLPCSPYEYCHSNITKSTFYRIRAEFLRGHAVTKDILRPNFVWSALFEQFPCLKKYTRFVKIYLSAADQDGLGDWVGWVKSRFRCLITKLEEVQGLCDPNPTEYVDREVAEPNMVFYWGLQPGRSNFTAIESVEKYFMKNINNGYHGIPGRMELSIVQASEHLNDTYFGSGSCKGSKACWKLSDYNQPRVPVYSQHLPNYFVGYAVIGGKCEYPNAGE